MTTPDPEPGAVRLCVLLWARPGRRAALARHEDEVLQVLARHGGRVLTRLRTTDGDGEGPGASTTDPGAPPDEVHVVELPSPAALDAYLADPARAALADDRDAVLERSLTFPVDVG